jgi:pimeloyl-ACP methyl ester carboxylesterase
LQTQSLLLDAKFADNIICPDKFSSSNKKMTTVTSQFIDVAGRRVLVRHAGSGPALVLLHQSPQTSRSLIPWIERLSKHYAVIAPDTPGFGFSDPLALSQPTIPDYAAALNLLMEKLGIGRALIFGVHTGAVTALRFSLDYPGRVAGLVCDGYARFNTDERQKLLNLTGMVGICYGYGRASVNKIYIFRGICRPKKRALPILHRQLKNSTRT